MLIDKKLALRMWDDIFGANKEMVIDCYGAYIKRSDYGDHETKRIAPDGKSYFYGWDIDHIRPRSDFPHPEDADFLNNLEPVHFLNNQEKSDNYPAFTIGGKQYKVVSCAVCQSLGEKGYGVVNNQGQRVDWKGVSNQCYVNKKQ